jgi:hypothetical protein
MARSSIFFSCFFAVTLASVAGCGGSGGVPIPNSSDGTEAPPSEEGATTEGTTPSGSATAKAGGEQPNKPGVPSPEPNKPAKRMFVTAKSYKGNLRDQAQAADGFQGGDKLCQAEATAAKLGGTWKAYLSGKIKNEPVKALERLVDVGPWYLVDGKTKVFDGLQGLTSMPLAKIDMLADGTKTTSDQAWTGSRAGVPGGPACEDMGGTSWSSSSYFRSGTNGNPLEIAMWSDDGSTKDCSSAAPLYCFEQ